MTLNRFTKLFLRVALAASFLSAVADRFGAWGAENSVWGTWEKFVAYTALINPWFPAVVIPGLAIVSTLAEIVLSICLLLGYQTKLSAKLSGVLLLAFGVSMALSTGVKGPLDYSVFTAAAAAFALACMNDKYLELDSMRVGRKAIP